MQGDRYMFERDDFISFFTGAIESLGRYLINTCSNKDVSQGATETFGRCPVLISSNEVFIEVDPRHSVESWLQSVRTLLLKKL